MRLSQLALIPAIVSAVAPPAPAPADVILQYFESRYETIERRLPDVFMAGYDALWIPPTSRADTGNFSVGYDLFDRFDLGNAFGPTLYGTEQGLRQMIDTAHRAGVLVFPDIVLNHNGFRDLGTPGFVDAGDYPGLVVTLPTDIDGDFHGRFESGDLNGRLAGLIDIAQEKNHVFIRHPVDPADSLNIPGEFARFSNRRFYPDTDFDSPPEFGDTSGDRHTPSGFNLDHPEAGDPVPENATGLLIRYVRWMNEVIGADGFRLDAVKHIPQWFFNDFYDAALFGTGPGGSTPFSFGEVFDGNFGLLASYTRKDGFGNRDVLDFPLFFRMRDVLSANGFGDMRALEFASFDGSDGNANDGTRGVQFVSSHDNGPPSADNIAYAHILTRAGFPVVYFNALEFGEGRDFPLRGRGDALGGQFGDLITRLVDIHHERARGAHRTRWIDSDVYLYERENALLVGLNDNGASAQTRTVDTAFRNVTLVELTGNPGASGSVAIGDDGRATVTIPSNASGLGYAMWSLPTPRGVAVGTPFEISPVASVLPADPPSVPNGTRRLTPLEVLTDDTATLTLRIEPEGLDDKAVVKIDDNAVDVLGTPHDAGDFAAYQLFAAASPSFGGGTGVYSVPVNVAALAEGPHFIEALAFLHRSPGGLPPLFQTFRKVIYVDRVPPPIELLFPTQTGNGDIQSSDFEVVLVCPDATADSVHVLPDFTGTDAEALAAVGAANRAARVDRREFRFTWRGIAPGLHSLTVVTFEPTGHSSVARFSGIDAQIALPAVRFANLPEVIDTAEIDDIWVQVDLTPPGGGPLLVFDPDGTGADTFDAELVVDGVVYPAQPFSPGLLGSTNTLYQNDNDLGDTFDTFRFNWRGYSAGLHQLEARAWLNDMSLPAAVASRTILVSSATPGPDFTIISPPPPAAPGDPPRALLIAPSQISVTVADLEPTARSVSAFIQSGEGELLLGTQAVDGSQSSVTLSGSPPSAELFNGTAIIRVQASTGPLGTGIATEKSTAVLLLGVTELVPPPVMIVIDGQDNDWHGTPPAEVHTTAVSNGEWIYTGAEDDQRTDLGDDPNLGNRADPGDFNMDLTELRVSQSPDKLLFLARLRDVTDVRRVSFALAIDTGSAGDATGVNFLGDESFTLLDTAARTWDATTQVHFTTTDFSRVEIFDDVGELRWESPVGEESFISAANDLVEFAIPRAVLGLDGPTARTISIQGATFENVLSGSVGWNNDVDSTRDISEPAQVPEAIDVLGGAPGVLANAWDRAFADDRVLDAADPPVVLLYDITIPAPQDSGVIPPPQLLGVDPPDLSVFTATTPLAVTAETDLSANSVLFALNGQIVAAALAAEGGGAKTWTATTPPLVAGSNSLLAVAFANGNFTGQIGTAGRTYMVELPEPTADEIVDHLLGVSPFDDPSRGDLNGDHVTDVADVVTRVLSP